MRDVSLSVNAGEIVTLLGPNGAGKTTTMRMLAGLILPTAGRISIDRHRARRIDRRARARQHRTADRSAGTVGAPVGPPQPPDLRAPARRAPIPTARVDEALDHVDLLDRAERDRRQALEGPEAARRDRAGAHPQAARAAARRADLGPRSGQRAARPRPDPRTAIRRPRHPGVHAQPGRSRGAVRSDRASSRPICSPSIRRRRCAAARAGGRVVDRARGPDAARNSRSAMSPRFPRSWRGSSAKARASCA